MKFYQINFQTVTNVLHDLPTKDKLNALKPHFYLMVFKLELSILYLQKRLLLLGRTAIPLFLFNFNQLVQVGHLVETYKWHPRGLGSCCKEVSYFLPTKNSQEDRGKEGVEFNLAAEKEFTKLLPSCCMMAC